VLISQKIGKNTMYLGNLITTNSTTYQFILNERELHPYRWLVNTIFFILLGMSILIGVFLFFIIPDKPTFALIFTILIAGGSILIRILIWIFWW
jgi:hypothetical protein